jgi:hypothetical protein
MKPQNKNLLRITLLWALLSGTALAAGVGTGTSLVTIMPHLILGNDNSYNPSLASGGTVVAFESDSFNFLPQDANNARDVFLANGKKISRVSINSKSEEARNCQNYWALNTNLADSKNAALSASGKFVVFESLADNLDLLTKDTDNNGNDPIAGNCLLNNSNGKESDIFIRDIAKKKTYRLSGIMDGADGNTLPAQNDVFAVPLLAADQPWKIVTEADDQSANPAISANDKAQVVVFQSRATNLVSVAGGTGLSSTFNCNGSSCNRWHIYALDLVNKQLELISATHSTNLRDPNNPHSFIPTAAGSDDSMSPSISADGRFVSYYSNADNLVGNISGTSNYDVFIYDRNSGKTYQLSGALSANPAPVAPNTQGYTVTAEGNDDSRYPSIAAAAAIKTSKTGANSLMIAFQSKATNLDPISDGTGGNADDDVFVVEFAIKDGASTTPLTADYEIKSLTRVSGAHDASGALTGEALKRTNSNNGAAQTANSTHPAIFGSKDAYVVTFKSDADNLYPPELYFWNEDTNKVADVYVWDSKLKLISRANVDAYGTQGSADAVCISGGSCNSENGPAISPDGKTIGFDTTDDYLVSHMLGNLKSQIFTRKYIPAKLLNPNLF